MAALVLNVLTGQVMCMHGPFDAVDGRDCYLFPIPNVLSPDDISRLESVVKPLAKQVWGMSAEDEVLGLVLHPKAQELLSKIEEFCATFEARDSNMITTVDEVMQDWDLTDRVWPGDRDEWAEELQSAAHDDLMFIPNCRRQLDDWLEAEKCCNSQRCQNENSKHSD